MINYQPKETFSPSGLSLARRCEAAWGYRYLLGLRVEEVPWAVISVQTPPKGDLASRAWWSLYRKALGTACHSTIEAYYKGQEIDWYTTPSRIVHVGLHLLPRPDQCLGGAINEGAINIDTRRVDAGVEPIRFLGYRDLVAHCPEFMAEQGLHGEVLLVDFKTTSDFKWIKSVSDLLEDEQVNLYGLDVMLALDLDQVAVRFVYFRTKGKPAADCVDLILTRAHAEANVRLLITQAVGLRNLMREKTDVETLYKNTNSCSDYGGCEFHQSRSGPCKAQNRTGRDLRALSVRDGKRHLEVVNMSSAFANKFAQFQKNSAKAAPAAEAVEEKPAPKPAKPGPGRPPKAKPTPAPEPEPETVEGVDMTTVGAQIEDDDCAFTVRLQHASGVELTLPLAVVAGEEAHNNAKALIGLLLSATS